MLRRPHIPATVLIFSLIGHFALRGGAAEKTASPLDDKYTIRTIEGWKVYVSKELLAAPKKLGDRVLKLLSTKLFDISRVVPPKALVELRKVSIWMELDNKVVVCGAYHPSVRWLRGHGQHPAKAKSIEFGNAERFLSWSHVQPWMVLHELAHAYHDRHIGHRHKELNEAFKQAAEKKLYGKVLYYNGAMRKAYAGGNVHEYFAELTEAYFGVNDFYPFVRAEVIRHDPKMYELLGKLWKKEGRRR